MLVHPPAELDPSTEADLEARLQAADPAGTTTVDFSGVTFCDSTGLRVLVAHQRRHAEAGGKLQVRGAAPSIRRVFEITGLEDLLVE